MPRIIFVIFLLAVLIRFLYFPENINFAYDQARDSFASLEILKGDLKILGPPTTAGGQIFHGALIFYILAPIYFLSSNSPEVAAAVFRIVNALGVFLIFYIAKIIFNKEIGFLSAFLFAISYEQSQYSLFFGHPAPGAVSVLIFYLGLALWIFKNKPLGFVIALAGLGLTIQFEDANGLLILVLMTYFLIFYRKLRLLNLKIILLGIFAFLLTTSTFIISEIKYGFRMSQAILSIISNFGQSSPINSTRIFSTWVRFIHDNFIANQILATVFLIGFGLCFILMLRKKNLMAKTIFLITWFLGGMLPHFLNPSFTYYYSPGATVGLLIIAAFLTHQLFLKNKLVSVSLLATIIYSNLFLVSSQNYKGPNPDIVIQPGMLTSNERVILDYIYDKSDGQPFAVNALTVPLNVKTTWDYIFNWYGKGKYGFVPVWGGEAADGFYGSLNVITDRSKLPDRRFTIIEPTVGIGQKQVEDFFENENYFSKVVEEKHFGTITVQERERI